MNNKEKNIKKYLSYKEAHKRIKSSISKEFFLEAITIQESIISDRLLSHLIGKGIISFREDDIGHGKVALSSLINKLGKNHSLYNNLDKWRRDRNICIHSMCKSYPGKPTIHVKDFLDMAKHTALFGVKLVKDVQKWHASEIKHNSLI